MRFAAFGLIITTIVCGCGKFDLHVDEASCDLFLDGKSYLQKGKTEVALDLFLDVIKQRKKAPESHFEAGYIYLTTLNDPYYAIYHFSEYLKLADPKKSYKKIELVRGLIDSSKKKIISELPGDISNNVDYPKLINLLRMIRDENAFLKKKINAYEERLSSLIENHKVSNYTTVEDKKSQNAKDQVDQKKYIVQPGDTLSTISLKFYGASSDWKKIYESNKTVLKNPTKLKIGQELNIP